MELNRPQGLIFVVRAVGEYPRFICGLDVIRDYSEFWLGLNGKEYTNFNEVESILNEAHPEGWHVYEEDYSIIASLKKFSDPEENTNFHPDLGWPEEFES